MGLHEWRYSNDYNPADRTSMRYVDLEQRIADMKVEAELGFDPKQAAREVERCLNCDIQTDFTAPSVHRVRRLCRRLPRALPHDHAQR